MRRRLPILLALLALSLPPAAHACAVCGAAVDRNRTAFLGTTILLSLLPLALMGGGLWWIARHARERLAGEFVEREPLAGAPEPPAGSGDAATTAPVTPSLATGGLFATPAGRREG